MKLNKLLQRQLNKYLPESCRDKEEFRAFLQAVNNSYEAYDRDLILSQRAFRITEEEYREINEQLKQEIEVRKASVSRLKAAVEAMTSEPLADDEELLAITSYLTKQIALRIETEQQLKTQKTFYERILNQIPADIAILDAGHRYLFVNPTAVKNPEIREWIIGKTEEEYAMYRNKPLPQLQERKKRFEETIKSGRRREWEEKIVKPDGSIEYHLRILYPVYHPGGTLDIMIIYGFDITERRHIEERIKLSEARYRSIFDNSQALICTHDLEGVILNVNRAAEKTFGYSKQELSGMLLPELIPEEKRGEFGKNYLQAIRETGKAEGIMTAYDKEGKLIYLLYQNYLVREEQEPYVIGFSQDITSRLQAEKALRKSEEKYRNIIANMNLGLVEVNDREEIMYVNNSFCDMSGYESDELIGHNAAGLFLKGANQHTGEEVLGRRREGISDAYELKVKNKRGALRWWLVSGAPVISSDGSFVGSIGIHLDITEQKRLEADLRKAKAEAEHSAQAKEFFLANMSHEIRTPMNAVLGISRLLQKTGLGNEQRLYLDTIQNAAGNLLVIINDLLDFSKIESGKIQLEQTPFNLEQLITSAASMLRHKAEEKGLALNTRLDTGIAPAFRGDPFRLNQVLVNLMGNAIKFTDKGYVDISCSVAHSGNREQQIRFRITDTGIGMDEKFLEHLFDKFTQEDETVTRRFGGTGLGMSITKQLVELMGGKIEVSSDKGKGTAIAFTLTLPLGNKEELVKKESTPIDQQMLKGKEILLVEDNEMNRLLARTILEQYGAGVTEAVNGALALECLGKEHHFDLILMDVHMPVKDGLATTRHIREHIDTSIPIVALTASAQKAEEERCLEAGMNDFITKPFEEEKLVQVVAGWSGRSTQAKKLAGTAPASSREALFNLDGLRELAKGDISFIRRMTGLFIQTIPETLEQMQEAAERDDWKTVAALAHRIKPSVHSMGARYLSREINTLELDAGEAAGNPEKRRALQALDEALRAVVAKLRELSF